MKSKYCFPERTQRSDREICFPDRTERSQRDPIETGSLERQLRVAQLAKLVLDGREGVLKPATRDRVRQISAQGPVFFGFVVLFSGSHEHASPACVKIGISR